MDNQLENTSLSIIDTLNIASMQGTITKIGQFQALVQSQLKQDHDFGIIPGTNKPTLLKPGAEKINMLMGLTSEFEIVDSTRDFKEGFFQYQVRAKLFKNGTVITEGLGSCNTKEKKYIKQDPFTMDNTVLKMAKKRAFVDATLLVGSLSDIFTQDIEDMDLNGVSVEESSRKIATDNGATITEGQAKRIFAIAKGDADLVKAVCSKYGYTSSKDIKKLDYEKIVEEVQKAKDAA
jgi:hypothetical protein